MSKKKRVNPKVLHLTDPKNPVNREDHWDTWKTQLCYRWNWTIRIIMELKIHMRDRIPIGRRER